MTGSLFELPCYGVSQQEVARKNLGAPDAVIYLNDVYEDGATPDAARKKRIDFTHTIKKEGTEYRQRTKGTCQVKRCILTHRQLAAVSMVTGNGLSTG